MRPPKHRQSLLWQPLNVILGTPANVRLLRALALASTPLSAGELSKRAALGRTSIYPALRQLERIGIVEFIGAGSRRLIQRRDRHPLARLIDDLFRAEAGRLETLTLALREVLSGLPHSPLSAWITETADDAHTEDTLTLHVVARPEELDDSVDQLNVRLADLERAYDVHIAVRGLTRSELAVVHRSASLDHVVLLAGVPPLALLARARPAPSSKALSSHDAHDLRARRLAVAVAAKIRKDPGLVATAEARVKLRAQKASQREQRELIEWMRLLSTMSPARLRRFLTEDSARAIRLRQTLPALNLLTPAERDAVVRSETDAEAVAAVTRR
ncbi:MAG: winged helix-turn-helix transcriptional regulator [Acidobacteria bacterium]|nr:winged helix-turn-helix transcriptional regulator [Acidobacteriota bacterium]